MFFTKKKKINYITPTWERIESNVVVDFLPRIGELTFLKDKGGYFIVLNVIHKKNDKKTDIFIVIQLLENQDMTKY